jgi:hypothetical protein
MTGVGVARQVAINAFTEHTQAQRELARIKQSSSWRLTAPYRWLARYLREEVAPKERSPYEGEDLSTSYLRQVAIDAYTGYAQALRELAIIKQSRSWRVTARSPHERKDLSSSYYQDLHDTFEGYQQNNWLVDRVDDVLHCAPKTILEIGCGNGRFARSVAERGPDVIASDWAASPMLRGLPSNVSFVKIDAVKDNLPTADLVCSSDVLEHFHPNDIETVVRKLHNAGRYNYHVVACYDDGHSHLTITSPGNWLNLFRVHSDEYRLVDIEARRSNPNQLVCVVSNF